MKQRGIERYRVISSEGLSPPAKSEKLALFNPDGTPYSPGGGDSFFTQPEPEFIVLGDPDTDGLWLGEHGEIDFFRDDADLGIIRSALLGESSTRYIQHADGSMYWGNGTDDPIVSLKYKDSNKLRIYGILQALSEDAFISFDPGFNGPDNSVIETGSLVADYSIFVLNPLTGEISWGDGAAAPDTTLKRSDNANLIVPNTWLIGEAGIGAGTDDHIQNGTGQYVFLNDAGFIEIQESDAGPPPPAAAPSGFATASIGVRVTGGKNELVARFPSGAVQQIAIEP